MFNRSRLQDALELLGDLLAEREQSYELLAIGGGALLLLGLSHRATVELDVVAKRAARRWTKSRPLPPELARAVDEVGLALGLPSDKPWLNDGPSFLFEMGLPDGWEVRTTSVTHGGLTVRLVARDDLIALKLWAATDARAPSRRARDVGDLRVLQPTEDELRRAVRWCRAKDGTAGSSVSLGLAEVARDLGFALDTQEVDDG